MLFRSLDDKMDIQVDGILLHAVLRPSELVPYYIYEPDPCWKLEDIAKQVINVSVLDNSSIGPSLELSATTSRSLKDLTHLLQPFKAYNQLKRLQINVYRHRTGCIDELVNLWPQRLTELRISGRWTGYSSFISPQTECNSMEKLEVDFFETGIPTGLCRSITELVLNSCEFKDPATWNGLAQSLSQLCCLNALWLDVSKIWHHRNRHDLTQVESASLRALDIRGNAATHKLAALFSGCHIERLAYSSEYFEDVEESFPEVTLVCLLAVSTPHRHNFSES